MKKISKIIYKDQQVIIHFSDELKKTEQVETVFRCAEAPKESFIETLQSFDDELIEILNLPENYKQNITITGLTIKHEDDGFGCCISALKKFSKNNSVFCINTPFQSSYDPNLNEDLQTKIGKMLNEANDYLNGVRLQANLFDKNEI